MAVGFVTILALFEGIVEKMIKKPVTIIAVIVA